MVKGLKVKMTKCTLSHPHTHTHTGCTHTPNKTSSCRSVGMRVLGFSQADVSHQSWSRGPLSSLSLPRSAGPPGGLSTSRSYPSLGASLLGCWVRGLWAAHFNLDVW